MQIGVIFNNRYQIRQKLGNRGFSVTYLAEDTHRFNEPCVIKELIPQVRTPQEWQKIEELFEREAIVLYKLQHPQIPRFREFFRLENRLFLAQDYIQGQTCRDILQIRQREGKTWTEAEVIQLLQNILPVFAYIHTRGIIHRNVSPDNLMLRHPDQLPVLIDFGTVKQLMVNDNQPINPQPVTAAIATNLGQMNYAPGEQITGGLVLPHSDLYALAGTILVLLTGKEPQELIDPKTKQPNWTEQIPLSSSLKNVLTKMLAPSPSDRFGKAAEVLDALNQTETELSSSIPMTAGVTQATEIISLQKSEKKSPNSPPTPTPNLSDFPVQEAENSTMTSTATRSTHPLVGCLGKLLLILLLSLTSGTVGWIAGKTWLNRLTKTAPTSDLLTSSQPDQNRNTSTISDQELQRKNEIKTRRINLNIDRQFFDSLVNQIYISRNPSQQGKELTDKAEDAQWREKWDNIALEILDKLKILSLEARQELGQYNQDNLDSWKRQVNQLHLSSRSLYDLGDGTFFLNFPEAKNQDFLDQPIGQVWQAIIHDQLQELQTGKHYQKIVISSDNLAPEFQGTLEAGEGQAYVVQFKDSQAVEIHLNTDQDTLFSIYSPTGKNNLLEDSPQKEWSGQLPEKGYYELTIVSQSKTSLNYQLKITLKDSNSN